MTRVANNERRAWTEAEIRATGMRWCTTCQREKPADGGVIRPVTNGRTKWICAACVVRIASRSDAR